MFGRQSKMQGFSLYVAILVLCSAKFSTGAPNNNSTAEISVASANTTENDTVVYSYSEANVHDGKPSVSQLTIARGKDGQYHYVKHENGTIKSGKWEGPLPATPDVSKLLGSTMQDITKNFEDPLAQLTAGIGNTLQDYINKNSFSF